MIKFTTNLYTDLCRQLQEVAVLQGECLERAMQGFHIAETALLKLKQFVHGYSFRNANEEIRFFKEIKPQFHSELLYYLELIHIETNKPRGCGKKELLSFFRQVSDRINLYFAKQNMLYLYYRTKRQSEDEMLFLRETDCMPMVPEDAVDMDTHFSTIASSNIARIMAFERVLDFIGHAIVQIERGVPELGTQHKHHAVWTHSKVALIELAYALHAADVVNFGKADVKQIVRVLENAFNIELGNFYRVFQNIRIRQGNRTAFLKELIEKLEARMDESDIGLN